MSVVLQLFWKYNKLLLLLRTEKKTRCKCRYCLLTFICLTGTNARGNNRAHVAWANTMLNEIPQKKKKKHRLTFYASAVLPRTRFWKCPRKSIFLRLQHTTVYHHLCMNSSPASCIVLELYATISIWGKTTVLAKR